MFVCLIEDTYGIRYVLTLSKKKKKVIVLVQCYGMKWTVQDLQAKMKSIMHDESSLENKSCLP